VAASVASSVAAPMAGAPAYQGVRNGRRQQRGGMAGTDLQAIINSADDSLVNSLPSPASFRAPADTPRASTSTPLTSASPEATTTSTDGANHSPVSPLSSRGAAVPARAADFAVVCRRCQQEGGGASGAVPLAICSGSDLFRSNHYVCAGIDELCRDAVVVSSLQRPRQVRDIMISGKLSCAQCRCPLGTVISLHPASNGRSSGAAKKDIGANSPGVGASNISMPCFKVREICLYDKLASAEEGEDPALLISGWSMCPWTLPLHQ
jgi:hypothetical protein